MPEPLSPAREAEIRSTVRESLGGAAAHPTWPRMLADVVAEIDRLRGTDLAYAIEIMCQERLPMSAELLQAQADLNATDRGEPERDAEPTTFPSRFSATPAEVDRHLRRILAEDTYLSYQQAIGDVVAGEAAEDIRAFRHAADKVHHRQAYLNGCDDSADWIDTRETGGPYPARLLCSKHDGFGPCPGAPRCTPRQDEGAES